MCHPYLNLVDSCQCSILCFCILVSRRHICFFTNLLSQFLVGALFRSLQFQISDVMASVPADLGQSDLNPQCELALSLPPEHDLQYEIQPTSQLLSENFKILIAKRPLILIFTPYPYLTVEEIPNKKVNNSSRAAKFPKSHLVKSCRIKPCSSVQTFKTCERKVDWVGTCDECGQKCYGSAGYEHLRVAKQLVKDRARDRIKAAIAAEENSKY